MILSGHNFGHSESLTVSKHLLIEENNCKLLPVSAGEQNSGHSGQYSCQIQALLKRWRSSFNTQSLAETAADFPFGYVQVSPQQQHLTEISPFSIMYISHWDLYVEETCPQEACFPNYWHLCVWLCTKMSTRTNPQHIISIFDGVMLGPNSKLYLDHKEYSSWRHKMQ